MRAARLYYCVLRGTDTRQLRSSFLKLSSIMSFSVATVEKRPVSTRQWQMTHPSAI